MRLPVSSYSDIAARSSRGPRRAAPRALMLEGVVETWEWWGTLARRWPVVLIGLLCTAATLYLVHKRPIVFEACGSVVVTAPKSSDHPNVYNSPQGSLIIDTGLITQQLNSEQVQHQLQAQGLTASYQAQLANSGTPEAPQYSAPLANVCASSHSYELSLRTANAVIQEFGTILQARQLQNAAPTELITDSVVVSPVSLPVTGHPSQAYLGVAAIGIILTAACAVWTDRLLRLRARRPRRADAAGNGNGGGKRTLRTLRPWRALTVGRSAGN